MELVVCSGGLALGSDAGECCVGLVLWWWCMEVLDCSVSLT